MRLRLLALIATPLCGVAVVLPSVAPAASGQASFALKPLTYDPALTATKSYFIATSKPGDVIRTSIRLVNTGTASGTAYLYPVDATTGQTSGAVYLSRFSPRRDVGSWIALGRSRATLGPGQDLVVPFTIRVPLAARPGDHLGGIVAENSALTKARGKGALRIRIKHLTIDAVEVQLPGPIVSRLDATGVKPGGEHGYQYVYVHLRNPGTIMLKPTGSLAVRNAKGRRVAFRSFALDTFLPRTEIDYPVLLPKMALTPGRYTATVALSVGTKAPVGYRKTPGTPFSVTRTFPFRVSSQERTKVYAGVAALTAPADADATASSGSRNRLIGGGLAALAGLLAAWLAFRFVRKRRARRAARSGAPNLDVTPTAAAAEPAEKHAGTDDEELYGWGHLLEAYDSPRRPAPLPKAPTSAPAPLAAAVVAESASTPEPSPEPVAAPEPSVPAGPEPASVAAVELGTKQVEQLILRHDEAAARGSTQPGLPTRPRAGSTPSLNLDAPGLGSALLGATALAVAGLIAVRLYDKPE